MIHPLIITHSGEAQDVIAFGPEIWLSDNKGTISVLYAQQPNPRKAANASFSLGRYRGFNFFFRTLYVARQEDYSDRVGQLLTVGVASKTVSPEALLEIWYASTGWSASLADPEGSEGADWEERGIRSLIEKWDADAATRLEWIIGQVTGGLGEARPSWSLRRGDEVSRLARRLARGRAVCGFALDSSVRRQELYRLALSLLTARRPLVRRNWNATVLVIGSEGDQSGPVIIEGRKGKSSGLSELRIFDGYTFGSLGVEA